VKTIVSVLHWDDYDAGDKEKVMSCGERNGCIKMLVIICDNIKLRSYLHYDKELCKLHST
jgi:hypothetical protein